MMQMKNIRRLIVLGSAVLALNFVGCSGEDGKDGISGTDGKDAAEVDVDSLASVLREEITGTLWDSLYAEPYVDTVYNILFDNAFASAWMDSVRESLLDSLKEADYDSLYNKLYDSVYTDIYSQQVIRTLDAYIWTSKENIYGAFANQYPLMYEGFVGTEGKEHPVPVSIKVRNTCDRANSSVPCRWKKVMARAWISGFADTSYVTKNVNPDSTIILAPQLKFDTEALLALNSPAAAQIQIEAYAFENDREIRFFTASESTTIHPMQIDGAEYAGVPNRRWWYGVWVTPDMDSLASIVKDVSAKLPEGTLKVYQLYADDEDMSVSSRRVAQAVFEVLQSRGISYVQDDGAASSGQRVQYPIEVLRSKQGICIETSMLFASVMERLGFDVAIVLVPKHSFIGWSVDEGSLVYDFIETTMIGSKATFAEAINKGNETFQEQQELGNFESGKSEIIQLKKVREFGIMPNEIP
ncbi:transglutaminase family protein [uncultured Fibrobacter sp.]|uniref:transglutaminase family protein n=1 Tax=uncultured Fibrobacter sp. TaxID=261512 RepID=UPI00261C4858|nr:transglutaminase family protein [uncultured Fibrobacter sp.]